MISDSLERQGLKLASLSPEDHSSSSSALSGMDALGNPLDIWPAVMLNGTEKAYSVALEAVLERS